MVFHPDICQCGVGAQPPSRRAAGEKRLAFRLGDVRTGLGKSGVPKPGRDADGGTATDDGSPQREGRMRRHWGIIAIAVAVSLVAVVYGWGLAYRIFSHRAEHILDESMALVVPILTSETSRFGMLSEVLRDDPRVIAVLSDPGPQNIAALKRYLQRIRERTSAAELSVLDANGVVVAASSWGSVPSPPGFSFAFRPYFRDALETGQGELYAVGLYTGLPGYYMSTRIDLPDGRKGVLVIKIDLSFIETSWQGAGTQFALIDGNGVVFLTNVDAWRYRSLDPLSAETRAAILRDGDYGEIDPAASPPLFHGSVMRGDAAVSHVEDGRLYRLRPVDGNGWRMMASRVGSLPEVSASLVAMVVALAGLVITGGIFIYLQRGEMVRIKSEQSRLLERRVEERTRELAEEVEVRRQTEQSLRDAEEGLVQAAKLAALGQMSTALAHEVSQPITALAAVLTAAERRLGAGEHEPAGQLIERAQSLVRRIQHIVRHLRSFARKDRGEGVNLRVAASLGAALELAETRAREIGVEIAVTGLGEKAEIFGSAVRLEQVLINLMLNALDAVAGRERREVGIDLVADETAATIRVWDSGPGIPEAIAEKPVPFYTTKSGQDGLGLGLSISQAILADFGARMRFMPRPGGGTICEVRLPLVSPARGAAAAE